jgi:hypothetical protein
MRRANRDVDAESIDHLQLQSVAEMATGSRSRNEVDPYQTFANRDPRLDVVARFSTGQPTSGRAPPAKVINR